MTGDATAVAAGLCDAAAALVGSASAAANLRGAALLLGEVDPVVRSDAARRALTVAVEPAPSPATDPPADDRYVAALRRCCSEFVAAARLDAAAALLAAAYERGDTILGDVAFAFVVDAIIDELAGAEARAAIGYAEAQMLERDVLVPPAG